MQRQLEQDIVRGIPADKWIHPELCDLARMTDKQRYAYFFTMGVAEIGLLMNKGNCVGEKPDKPINIYQWIKERERAHQRAMTYQFQVYEEE